MNCVFVQIGGKYEILVQMIEEEILDCRICCKEGIDESYES